MATDLDHSTQAPAFIAEDRYECVDGRFLEAKSLGAFESDVTSLLFLLMGSFVFERRLGRIVSETLFSIEPSKGLKRRPDLAFVSQDRWPLDRPAPRQSAWDVIPDLAVEVVSPTNTASEIVVKVAEYFHAGVREVWVVYPVEAQIYAFQSPRTVRVFLSGDTISESPAIPDFQLRLSEVFKSSEEETRDEFPHDATMPQS